MFNLSFLVYYYRNQTKGELMKKILGMAFAILVMLGAISTFAFADPAKGQRYYLKFMKETTGINGAEFSAEHTQAEWAELFDGEAVKFIEDYSKKYPNAADFLKGKKFKKVMPHIKDFLIYYAKDSGNVPAC